MAGRAPFTKPFCDCTLTNACGMQGLPVTSMQWGAWGGTGMAVAHNLLPRIIKSGLGVLAPTAGLVALSSMLQQAAACSLPSFGLPAQLVVSPLEWHKLMAGAKVVFPLFSEFSASAAPGVRNVAPVQVELEQSRPPRAVAHGQKAIEGAVLARGPARDVLSEVHTIAMQLLGRPVESDQVRMPSMVLSCV